MTAGSNCLTVRCFRARATSSKLDCRRLSVQFVKMENFDKRMSDGPEQMPEQPDSPVDLTALARAGELLQESLPRESEPVFDDDDLALM